MRNEDRIDAFLKELGELWHQYPDWRFGQLVSNMLGDNIYYIEDDVTLQCIVSMAEKTKGRR